jgi:hypothetical protein
LSGNPGHHCHYPGDLYERPDDETPNNRERVLSSVAAEFAVGSGMNATRKPVAA